MLLGLGKFANWQLTDVTQVNLRLWEVVLFLAACLIWVLV